MNLFLRIITLSPLLCSFFWLDTAIAQHSSLKASRSLIGIVDHDFKVGVGQYEVLASKLPSDRFPKTYYSKTGKMETSDSKWWCSGFYPGTLLYLYKQTHHRFLLTEAERMMSELEQEQYNKTTHDLGFMMYCSFGTALKIAPKAKYQDILLNSAKSLSSRFDPKVGCIKSWDSEKHEYLVIIDNMMNLELLFWATQVTGDSSFYKVAFTHALTTMKNHFRSDFSSYHVVNYNPLTGVVQERKTAQGYADESAWARGQSWGLYGYTVAYRETKDPRFLKQAQNIAAFILHNPNLPADKIPYWDYNAPQIPNALRDASAASVMASAFFELCHYSDPNKAKLYFKTAEIIIRTLSSCRYLAVKVPTAVFIKHSVGHMPNKTEIDVPLTYGDYYFAEALSRYKDFK